MDSKPFTIALIGLGGVAQAHLQAFKLLPQVDIVAVCDTRAAVAQQVAADWTAEAFSDYQQLLDYGFYDLVLVLTPASAHREIVEATARAGFDVFCEKPLAVSLDDGEAMVAACEQAGVRLFYGSCYRYLPAIIRARELIQQGAIGEIQLMSEQLLGGHGLAGYRELAPIHYPLGGPGGPGMGIVDHGVHLIDIFSWFNPHPITAISGRGLISGAAPCAEYMAMTFANGAMGHLLYTAASYSAALPNEGMFSGGQGWQADCSLLEPGVWEPEPGSISIYGSEGALRIFHYTNGLFLRDAQGLRQIALQGRPAFGHFATQLEDCIEAIRQQRPPSVSGEDGVNALRTMLGIYNSSNAPADTTELQGAIHYEQ